MSHYVVMVTLIDIFGNRMQVGSLKVSVICWHGLIFIEIFSGTLFASFKLAL